MLQATNASTCISAIERVDQRHSIAKCSHLQGGLSFSLICCCCLCLPVFSSQSQLSALSSGIGMAMATHACFLSLACMDGHGRMGEGLCGRCPCVPPFVRSSRGSPHEAATGTCPGACGDRAAWGPRVSRVVLAHASVSFVLVSRTGGFVLCQAGYCILCLLFH